MERQNPLLPFAFSTSAAADKSPLNTTPRNRQEIDENARSMYHTRGSPAQRKGPTLNFMPSLKRKMGESFNDNDHIKRTALEELSSENTFIDPEPDKLVNQLPSSPTLDQHFASEFDESHFDVPESPGDSSDGEKPRLQPLKSRKLYVHEVSSEADFGIDQFNRFRSLVNQCPSTDRDYDSDTERALRKRSQARARDIVIECFENANPNINLEGLELTEIPEEIEDFDNLVVFDFGQGASYQLYLTNNKLRTLRPQLFSFTKLNVLSLRQNRLTHIPPLISRLTNLVDLSVSSNRLEWLPIEILELPKLEIFRAGPNPFIKVSDDAIPATTATLNAYKTKKYFSPVRWKHPGSCVPSLRTLCLHKIATYDVTYQETRHWKSATPKMFHLLIASAISKGKFGETCSECPTILVEPVAEAFEWWDVLQNKEVPFRRAFCSGKCARKWERASRLDS